MYIRFHKYTIEIKLKKHVLRVWEVEITASLINTILTTRKIMLFNRAYLYENRK